MKKSTAVAGLVVLAGAAYVGATWYVGQQAEVKIRQVVEEADQGVVNVLGRNLKYKGLTLSVRDYKRGWFSSEVVYQLTAQDTDGKTIDISFFDDLQHGPFPISALKAGDFAPLLAYSQTHLLPSEDIQPWFDGQKGSKGHTPLYAETRIGFGGKGSSVWTFSPVDYENDDNKFVFSGGAVTVDFSNDFKDSVTKGAFNSLSALDQTSRDTLSIKDVSISGSTITKDQTVTSNSSLTVKELIVGGTEDMVMEDISMTMNGLQQDNILDGTAQYKIGRVGAMDVNLGSLDMTASVAKLNITAVHELLNNFALHSTLSQADEGENAELIDQLEVRLQEKLLEILAGKPQVSINPFIWANSAGQSTASLLIDLNAPADLQVALEDPMTALTEEILEKIKLDINIPRVMLIQTLKTINSVTDENPGEPPVEVLYDKIANDFGAIGLLQSDEHGLKMDFSYQNNQVILNGKEMPLQGLMMLLMMMAM